MLNVTVEGIYETDIGSGQKNIPVLIIRSKHQEQQNADWVHM